MTTPHRAVLLAVAAAIGCGSSAAAQPSADTGTSTSPVESTDVLTAGPSDGSSTTIDIPSPDLPDEACDLLTQDCPAGHKCVFVASDSGPAFDAAICVPIAEDPKGIGEPCTSEGWATGVDDCESGATCWFLDQDNLGTCVGYCIGTPDDPSCADPNARCISSSSWGPMWCLPTCHPLQDDCAMGQVCIPNDDEFLCALDADPDNALGPGDDCGFSNVCDHGHFCGTPTSNPACDPAAPGCCIAFCDLTAPDCPGAECVPWYDPAMAPDGYENLGACVVLP